MDQTRNEDRMLWSARKTRPYYLHFKVIYEPDLHQFR